MKELSQVFQRQKLGSPRILWSKIYRLRPLGQINRPTVKDDQDSIPGKFVIENEKKLAFFSFTRGIVSFHQNQSSNPSRIDHVLPSIECCCYCNLSGTWMNMFSAPVRLVNISSPLMQTIRHVLQFGGMSLRIRTTWSTSAFRFDLEPMDAGYVNENSGVSRSHQLHCQY